MLKLPLCALLSAAALQANAAATTRKLQPSLNLPLVFESDPETGGRFVARGRYYNAAITAASAVLAPRADRIRLRWRGANTAARGTAEQPLRGKSNYFIGSDPKRWRTNVTQYARVRFQDLYPGIDLVYYGNAGRVEYDLVVRPGGDLRTVSLQIDAPAPVRLDAQGSLLIKLPDGELRQHRPAVYQEIDGERRPVAARYVFHGKSRVSFEVASYDTKRALIVDPILSYVSYLGGSRRDDGHAIAADAAGNAYVTGFTESSNFPTKDPLQSEYKGTGFIGRNAFVTKVNPAGNEILYSTYLGGTRSEEGLGIAVDESGNVFVAGSSTSTDFPTTPGALNGTATPVSFLTKLNPQGSGLVYSALLAGAAVSSIALDSGGNVYLTGSTGAAFRATPGALQTASRRGFIAKVNSSGSAYVYATFFDIPNAIAVDPAGNAYVTGMATSADFPITGTAISPAGEVFVSKLNPAGSALVYSTRVGGNQTSESGRGIAVDQAGNAHVTGEVRSTSEASDFLITPGAYSRTCRIITVNSRPACVDGFAFKLNAAGTSLIYSTYLNDGRVGEAVAVDPFGNANVLTQRGNVMRFDANGTSLLSSVRAQIAADALAMAMDPYGNLYFTGRSASGGDATADAFQSTFGGNQDAYVVRVGAVATVSAASLKRAALAPLSIASAFGEGLASGTESASSNPPPQSLRDTTVKIIDSAGAERNAPLFFVSPGQINFLIPEGTAEGAARLVFTAADGRVQTDALLIDPVAPAIFSARASGEGVAAAIGVRVSASGAQTSGLVFRFDAAQNAIVPVPQDLGGEGDRFVLQLFGTGIRGRTSLSAVRAKVGDDDCTVLFAGPQGEFAGLDQVNLLLPQSLIGWEGAEITLTVDGRKANVVTVSMAGVPKPRISSFSSWGGEAGQTIANLVLRGRFLGGVSSLQFSPGDGLTVTNVRAADTMVTAQVAIASTAPIGTRLASVTSGAGVSGPLPFTVRAAGTSPVPRISNVTLNGPTLAGRNFVLSGRFDFTDADGDVVFLGSLQNSARLRLTVLNTCTLEAAGEFLHKPGETSGSVDFLIAYRVGGPVAIGTFFAQATLIDAAGRSSNSISIPKSLWFCGPPI